MPCARWGGLRRARVHRRGRGFHHHQGRGHLDEAGCILLQDYQLQRRLARGAREGASSDAFYAAYPRARVAGAAATGYGEELVKNAFRMDAGIVETMAHFTAARAF